MLGASHEERAKVRGELPPKSQECMDMHLEETLSRLPGRASFIARLLSVTSDFDGSQHLVYEKVEGVSALEGIACYLASLK